MLEKAPDRKAGTDVIRLISRPEIIVHVNDINAEYLYWDKVKYRPVPEGITPQDMWNAVKMVRRVNYHTLFQTEISSGFQLYVTDAMQRMLHEFDMNIGGYSGTQDLLSDEHKERYLISSLMEEAIASSVMEGASSTRRMAKEMLRKELKPTNRSEKMIANNYSTLRYISSIKDSPLTPQSLSEIHRRITKDTLENPDYEGRFRDSDDIFVVNHLESELVHTPPLSRMLPRWIELLCDFFNGVHKEEFFIHPIVRAIIVHFMVGYIHPFRDGNGRTARALFYWHMLRNGYWLTEYLSISRIIYTAKDRYEKAFIYTETDENDLSYFVLYNLEVMQKAYASLKKYIQRKLDERKDNLAYLGIPGINVRQAELLKRLAERPSTIFTVNMVKNLFDVTYPTARADLLNLAKLGLVREVAKRGRIMSFGKTESFERRIEELKQI